MQCAHLQAYARSLSFRGGLKRMSTQARNASAKPTVPETYVLPETWESKSVGGPMGAINRATAGSRFERPLPRGAHALQLYSLATPNGQKVTIMLEELNEAKGVEYDAFQVNILPGPEGQQPAQFGSGFVEVNPNSKVPALIDTGAVSDTKKRRVGESAAPAASASSDVRVFESGHILLYLAEKYSFGIPPAEDVAARVETLNWLFWLHGAAPYLGGGFGHFYKYAPTHYEYAVDRFTMEAKRILDVLDHQLEATGSYVAGSEYTIADMAIYPWIECVRMPTGYNAAKFISFDADYKHIVKWMDRIEARPAVKRGMRVNHWTTTDKWGEPVPERHSSADFHT